MDREGISPTRFAEIVGVQRSSVSHILSGRNNPSLDFIQKILTAFPKLNSNWLITGKGDVYRQIVSQTDNIPQPAQAPEKLTDGHSAQNLFSLLNDEAPAKYHVAHNPDKENSTVTHKQDDVATMGNGGVIAQELSESNVEKIVIFYKDRTFREYRPA